MAEQFIECPKDPSMKYLKNVCENIFRRNGFRIWCQKCRHFESSGAKQKITTK